MKHLIITFALVFLPCIACAQGRVDIVPDKEYVGLKTIVEFEDVDENNIRVKIIAARVLERNGKLYKDVKPTVKPDGSTTFDLKDAKEIDNKGNEKVKSAGGW